VVFETGEVPNVDLQTNFDRVGDACSVHVLLVQSQLH